MNWIGCFDHVICSTRTGRCLLWSWYWFRFGETGSWCRGGSPSLLAVDGEGQRDVERVVVLHQRGVLVVQHQLLQRPVQVVGLGETETGAGLVDDAVLHLSVHTEGDKDTRRLDETGEQH